MYIDVTTDIEQSITLYCFPYGTQDTSQYSKEEHQRSKHQYQNVNPEHQITR